MASPDAVVVGAGPAGLACAASMRAKGLKVTLLERSDSVGSAWRRHYDRLHLHTGRNHSGLPLLPMPRLFPRYPSRLQLIAYLEDYSTHFKLDPLFNRTVRGIRREQEIWRVAEDVQSFLAPIVVVATGWAGFPYRPVWPSQPEYQGRILHSSDYRNPDAFKGQRVLVVGFGNSGGEIALDLAEAGVQVTLAVRGPVQILPRDLLGFPIASWAIAQRRLPARVADFINAPAIRLAVGSIDSLGLQRASKGPRRMVEEDGRVPLLDIGTIAKMRSGTIKVRPGIDRFTTDGVVFTDGRTETFASVVLATGYRPDLRPLLPDTVGVLDGDGRPLITGGRTAQPGLFFCGFIASPTGQLREIGIEAERIAVEAQKLVESH